MNRLFLKLLGWLLLANVITVLAVFLLARPLLDTSLSARNVQVWGEQAVTSYEQGGQVGLQHKLGQLRHEQRVLAMLYDASGGALARGVPRQMRHWPPKTDPHHAASSLSDRAVAQWMDGTHDRYRWVVVSARPSSRTFAYLRLVASLLGILLAAWFVAWWLIRPIRQLRSTTAAMAQGSLSARVPEKLARRRDELGQLAEEFNAMASRVQKLVETKERLLRDVSHELRSPLARLEVALEMARTDDDHPGKREKALQRIALESSRLDTLLEQVLTLARLEQGETELQRAPTDLVSLLEECAADLELTSPVPIKVTAPAELIIDADALLLRSAVENLLRNAQHYTATGTTVHANLSQEQDSITLRVSDHGPGVPEDMLEAIFQPFVRTSSARDRNSGGHGIGLAIVARACQAHGGTVSARNLEHGGLEVSARLPIMHDA